MSLTLLLLTGCSFPSFLATTADASSYFPLVPGSTWRYEEVIEKDRTIYEERLEEPVEFDGQRAWPITSYMGGQKQGSTFYRADQEHIWVVSFEKKKTLPRPYPILKIGAGTVKWTYMGSTYFYGSEAPLEMLGEAKKVGMRDVLGKKVECVEVKLEAKVGGNVPAAIKSNQVMLYGQGVGLVEMRETGQIGKRKVIRVRKLIEFQLGKSLSN